jgi:hypothetical protein
MLTEEPVRDRRLLCQSAQCVYIKICQKERYLPDLIFQHRWIFRYAAVNLGCQYLAREYRRFDGQEYPLDLREIQGSWLEPLPQFTNLQVLDLDIMTAIYWLIPILKSSSNQTLRRIIFRDTEKLDNITFPLPLEELDLQLSEMPAVKVILLQNTSIAWVHFRKRMPLLYSRKGLKRLFPKGKRMEI